MTGAIRGLSYATLRAQDLEENLELSHWRASNDSVTRHYIVWTAVVELSSVDWIDFF